jgi:hypothetical protein
MKSEANKISEMTCMSRPSVPRQLLKTQLTDVAVQDWGRFWDLKRAKDDPAWKLHYWIFNLYYRTHARKQRICFIITTRKVSDLFWTCAPIFDRWINFHARIAGNSLELRAEDNGRMQGLTWDAVVPHAPWRKALMMKLYMRREELCTPGEVWCVAVRLKRLLWLDNLFSPRSVPRSIAETTSLGTAIGCSQ